METHLYSYLENPIDRGDWWATVHGVTNSWTGLSNWAYTYGNNTVPNLHYLCVLKNDFNLRENQSWKENILVKPVYFLVSLEPNLVQFSHSVMFNSLQHHGLQHARLLCPSPTPGSCSNSCHRVSDAIQPSHPLLYPSPPALNLSQHQGLFKWVSSSHQVVRVLEFQLQHQSSMNKKDWSPLGWTCWISL